MSTSLYTKLMDISTTPPDPHRASSTLLDSTYFTTTTTTTTPIPGPQALHDAPLTEPLAAVAAYSPAADSTTFAAGLLTAYYNNSNDNGNDNSTLSKPIYDHHGAMLFTVATVCVYGLAIVFFIAGHLQKRDLNKDEERQISKYLKRLHLEEPQRNDLKFHVIKLKSQLLVGSTLGQRHNRRVSLLPRTVGRCLRRRGDDLDDDGLEEYKREIFRRRRRGLLERECDFQFIDEESESSPAVMARPPFRQRRHGCVGIGFGWGGGDNDGDSGDVDGSGGGDSDGSGGDGDDAGSGKDVGSQRPRSLKFALLNNEGDEVSMYSLKGVSSSERQDSAQSQTPGPEDAPPNYNALFSYQQDSAESQSSSDEVPLLNSTSPETPDLFDSSPTNPSIPPSDNSESTRGLLQQPLAQEQSHTWVTFSVDNSHSNQPVNADHQDDFSHSHVIETRL